MRARARTRTYRIAVVAAGVRFALFVLEVTLHSAEDRGLRYRLACEDLFRCL